MEPSDIQYARSGDVAIAYQTVGDGPIDVVLVTGFVSNILYAWESPAVVRFYERLASFCRLIRFDRRGTGLSDRPRDVPTLETRMDDVRAVMAATGSTRAALIGTFEAAPMTALFAATYPERVAALVMYNPYAKAVRGADYPWARTVEEWQADLEAVERGWGTADYTDEVIRRSFPSMTEDAAFRSWLLNIFRYGASPGAALTVQRMAMDVDVRDVLPAIRVPTLILHEASMRGHAEYAAARIQGAERVELAGEEHSIWLAADAPEHVERFVRGSWAGEEEPETTLSTVLFTDIVRSTELTAELGDRRWRDVVGAHHAVTRRQLDRFRGRELDTAGDGFFASFDGPARAIRCARAIVDAVRELGIEVRAGLHTGECVLVEGKPGGLAVSIGARVAARAGAGEVLVSSTVKDLVAGSGIPFEDRGVAELKGVPGEWRLYAVGGE